MAEAVSKLAILVQVRDEAAQALGRIASDLETAAKSAQNFASDVATLSGEIGAIGAAGFGFAIKEAMDWQTALVRAGALIKGTGVEIDLVANKAKEMSKGVKFSEEEVLIALARNIGFYKDYAKAVDATWFAMDLATVSGWSLEQVQKALAKTGDESYMALKMLATAVGVDLPASLADGTNKAEQMTRILELLREKVTGAATAAGNISPYQRLWKEIKDLAQQIGETAIPIVKAFLEEHILPVIQGIKKWVDEHPELFKQIVELGLLVTGAALTLAGFGAGLALLAKIITVTVVPAIKLIGLAIAALPLTVAITISLIGAAWVLDTLNKLRGEMDALNAASAAAADMNMRALNKAKELEKAGDTEGAAKLRATVQGQVNSYSSPQSGWGQFWPFAEGGVVTRPTLGLVGEAGSEAVIPLNRFGSLGGQTINVYLQGDFYTTEEVAERWASSLARILKYNLNVAVQA
jgi:hypothetical protein